MESQEVNSRSHAHIDVYGCSEIRHNIGEMYKIADIRLEHDSLKPRYRSVTE